MTNGERILEARLVDDTLSLHVDELCERLHVERQWMVELVELGALEPASGAEPSAWAFSLADLPRVRAMSRLVADLGVNLPGAAIILELVEERRRLLAQLRQWALTDV
jgi:chaperone modulatory protein CbpM